LHLTRRLRVKCRLLRGPSFLVVAEPRWGKGTQVRIIQTSLLLCLAAVLLLSPARAAENWGASFDSIRAAAKTVSTVQARFTQHKHLKILARPLESKGRFVFAAPDSIRWEYESPVRSVLLMRAGKLKRLVQRDGAWVSDASGQVQTMRVVVEQIQAWLLGRFEDNPVFTAKLVPGTPVMIELRPKDKALTDFIQKIVLRLSDTPGQLASVEIVESKNASTLMTFEGVVLNGTMGPDAFRAPK
jgi:outer membrane lipoprotein carrier protein